MRIFFKTVLPLCLLGLGAGFINGLLGAGGGVLVVLGLRWLYRGKVKQTQTIYASTIAVMLPLSAFSAWQYYAAGNLPDFSFWGLALPAALGGIAGALLLKKIKPKLLNRLFSAAILVAGILMVV